MMGTGYWVLDTGWLDGWMMEFVEFIGFVGLRARPPVGALCRITDNPAYRGIYASLRLIKALRAFSSYNFTSL